MYGKIYNIIFMYGKIYDDANLPCFICAEISLNPMISKCIFLHVNTLLPHFLLELSPLSYMNLLPLHVQSYHLPVTFYLLKTTVI